MHAGIWLTQNQDSYSQKCTAFMLPGPMLMQMSTGLVFGPVAHAHCHFYVRHRDVYLITHSLHSHLIPDHSTGKVALATSGVCFVAMVVLRFLHFVQPVGQALWYTQYHLKFHHLFHQMGWYLSEVARPHFLSRVKCDIKDRSFFFSLRQQLRHWKIRLEIWPHRAH